MVCLQARHFDMISNLPDSVMDSILVKLPTIDAVRMSILSRKWRYNWMKLSQFSLDECLWKSVVVKDSARSMVTMILCQLMLNHEGPVLKFSLSIKDFDSCPIIDSLIIFLSRNNIEDFTLEMWKDAYSVPASIFKCQLLRHLKLQYCRVSNPREFKGFSNLTTLTLIDIIISDEALRSLLSKSPLLESLELSVISCDLDIYIDAPNLRKFSFDGYAKSISLQLMPLLASVSITLDDISREPCKECSLTQFFESLPAIENLYLDFCIIERFAIEPKLSTTLEHLQDVDPSLISFDKKEVQLTLCLLKSSPNLKSIEIEFQESLLYSSEAITYMRGEDYSDIWLSQLTYVVLCGVTGSETELEFIKLLLSKSPSLERILIISGNVDDNGHKILKEVVQFQRVSKEAQVIYRE